MELQRAKVLQHDLIKSYVRLPDLQQKRMVEFAHSIGVPVATHEIYPGSVRGRGQHRAHGSHQPARLFAEDGDAAAGLPGRRRSCSGRAVALLPDDLGRRRAPQAVRGRTGARERSSVQALSRMDSDAGQKPIGGAPLRRRRFSRGSGKMVMDIMRAGGLVVSGTDTPNAVNLHGELMAYMMAGMTPFEALKAATVNPAKALGLNAGTIEAGKLADLVMVDGDPLVDIASAHKVKRVIANGRLFEMSQLLSSRAAATTAPRRR